MMIPNSRFCPLNPSRFTASVIVAEMITIVLAVHAAANRIAKAVAIFEKRRPRLRVPERARTRIVTWWTAVRMNVAGMTHSTRLK